MSTQPKTVSKSKINKLPENKAKRHIYNNANAGNSGGPVVDVKAWKAAQKAAASGKTDEEEESKKQDRTKRFAGTEAAKAVEASSKEALAAVSKSDKKGEVVKGFINQLTGKDKGGSPVAASGSKKKGDSDGSAGGGSGLVSAAPQNTYFQKTPRILLTEHCQKQKLGKPGVAVMEEKGGTGFKGKFILHAKEKGGQATVRITKRVYSTAQEAQEAAAVLGLYAVAGDRRMDRLMGSEFVPMWKEAEAAEQERKEQQEQAEERRKHREEAEARRAKREAQLQPLYLSDTLCALLESALNKMRDMLPWGAGAGRVEEAEDEGEIEATLCAKGWTAEQAKEGAKNGGGSLDGALDWLCVTVPQESLPRAFSRRVPTMPFHVKSNRQANQPQAAPTISPPSAAMSEEERTRRVLIAMGYPPDTVTETLQQTGGDPVAAVCLLEAKGHGGAAGAGGGGEEAQAEEVEALEAIYAESFEKDGGRWRVNVDVGLTLEVTPGSTYPEALPDTIAIRGDSVPSRATAAWMVRELYKVAEGVLGGPMVFELVSWLQGDEAVTAREQCETAIAKVPASGGKDSEEEKVAEEKEEEEEKSDGQSVASTERGVQGSAGGSRGGRGGGRGGGRRRGGGGEGGRDPALAERLKREESAKEGREDWQAMQKIRARLPAAAKKDEIVTKLRERNVLVVSGETGCGKTTQVPQFLLDEMLLRGDGDVAGIICTQPRRISAVGVAERVAKERCAPLGSTVGYQIRLESKRSADTRLMFCTAGILLRRLTEDRELAGVSHVVVDEVHERSVDGDLLLILLRQVLQRRERGSSPLKVVLMSATLDAESFCRYFAGAPAVHIPGFTHPVTEVYLEESFKITGQLVGRGSPYALDREAFLRRKKEGVTLSARTIAADETEGDWVEEGGELAEGPGDGDGVSEGGRLDNVQISMLNVDESKVNYELIELLIHHICSAPSLQRDGPLGAVLVFLPGMGEIQRAHDRLAESQMLREYPLMLVPLHSSLPSTDQVRVFQRAGKGVRKVVLATNIAETSITIDDVVFVIDAGLAREVAFDAATGLSRLVDVWVSQAAARQRRGRAGRVQAGYCFRLFSKRTFDAMERQQQPEMLRVPLQALIMQVMDLNPGGSVWTFLRSALTPPSRAAVEQGMATLRAVGAIEGGRKGEWILEGDQAKGQWRLSELGKHLAKLPVDVRLARMLIYGAVFGCVDPILTVAATMSTRSPFVCPFEKREAANKAKRAFSKPRDKSDHILAVRAYDAWLVAKAEGGRRERVFCEENFLSSNTLRTIADLRRQFADVLADAGFLRAGRARGADGAVVTGDASNKEAGNIRLIRAVICAGLYPNVVRVQRPETTYVEQAGGAVAQAPSARELKLFTCGDGRVFLHPSSINFSDGEFVSPWLVYHDKQATSKVFIRDSSMVTPYALVLFGGDISVLHERGEIRVDDWIRLAASARVGVLLKGLRGLLDCAMAAKLQDPESDISSHPAVHALHALLAFE